MTREEKMRASVADAQQRAATGDELSRFLAAELAEIVRGDERRAKRVRR